MGQSFIGNKVVLTAKFDAPSIWDLIATEKINLLMITGDAMARPIIEAHDADKHDSSSLFALGSSAVLFSQSLKDQYLDRFPNLVITDAIGSSESGGNGLIMVTKGMVMKGGPTVRPSRDSIVLDENLEPVVAGSGVVGRLARGGNIPLGYYKDPEKTAATFITAADGLRYAVPGDFAQVEADGSITMLGRGSVSINSGGEKIFPEEVEAAVVSHPAVYDAVVVGVPDERWGERVAAVVQARPGMTPELESVQAHCRTKVAGYKVPRELHLVDHIVRSPSGKPDYRWARATARGELDAPTEQPTT
jgi:acyl-CoA synthetase (AMP-forming)/AMP-acid ligase II